MKTGVRLQEWDEVSFNPLNSCLSKQSEAYSQKLASASKAAAAVPNIALFKASQGSREQLQRQTLKVVNKSGRGRNGRTSPAPTFTSCGTHAACSWLDSGLCGDGLHRLLLIEDRRIYHDADQKNLKVKLDCLTTKICLKLIIFKSTP